MKSSEKHWGAEGKLKELQWNLFERHHRRNERWHCDSSRLFLNESLYIGRCIGWDYGIIIPSGVHCLGAKCVGTNQIRGYFCISKATMGRAKGPKASMGGREQCTPQILHSEAGIHATWSEMKEEKDKRKHVLYQRNESHQSLVGAAPLISDAGGEVCLWRSLKLLVGRWIRGW